MAKPAARILALLPFVFACDGTTQPRPTPQPAAIGVVSGNAQTGFVGQQLAQPITVRVDDGSGDPTGGVSVSFNATDGTVSPTAATTGSDGLASTAWTLGPNAGPQQAIASVGALSAPLSATAEAGGAAVIGPAGGSFSFMDGDLSLEVPRGAVIGDIEITIRAGDEGPASHRLVPGTLYDFEPDGLTFEVPVTLSLAYDPDRLAASVDPELLRVHRFVDGAPQLVVGGRLELGKQMVKAPLRGFSEYGVAEASANDLFEGLGEMMEEALNAGDEAYAELLAAIYEDISTLIPIVEGECVETPYLALKHRWISQLLGMLEIVQYLGLGLDDEFVALCGGLLDPDQTWIEVKPSGDIWLLPGASQKLTATMFGPGPQELVGEVAWTSGDPEIANVSQEGVVSGISTGRTAVVVASADIPSIAKVVQVVVAPDLEVEVAPIELVLPMGRSGTLVATVRDTTTGDVLTDFPVSWRIVDEAVAHIIPSLSNPYTAELVPAELGVTTVVACVVGLDDRSCGQADMRVVWNVAGTWEYRESLTVHLQPPASETCSVRGTMTIVQEADTYTGTLQETETCTWNPGDGSASESETIQATGEIRNGKITGEVGVHEVYLNTGEFCRAEGTGTNGVDGYAYEVVANVGCVDAMGYTSSGSSHGTWVSGPR